VVSQVFLDIVEQVNVLMNSKGSVLRCDVNGKMIMKAYLSGMPEIKVGLNDRLEVRPCHAIPAPSCCAARASCLG
jgi:AP-2 complex subunit mu-1